MAISAKTKALHRILDEARKSLIRCGAYWKTDNIGSSSCPNMATRIVTGIPCCTFHANEARYVDYRPMPFIHHSQAELILAIEIYDEIANGK